MPYLGTLPRFWRPFLAFVSGVVFTYLFASCLLWLFALALFRWLGGSRYGGTGLVALIWWYRLGDIGIRVAYSVSEMLR